VISEYSPVSSSRVIESTLSSGIANAVRIAWSLRKALEMGYRRIAVTVNGFAREDLNMLRDVENEAGATVRFES